jgi:hypothetical protein
MATSPDMLEMNKICLPRFLFSLHDTSALGFDATGIGWSSHERTSDRAK